MTKPEKIYGFNLTQYDKDALVAFLKTFTDEAFLKNSAHSNPIE